MMNGAAKSSATSGQNQSVAEKCGTNSTADFVDASQSCPSGVEAPKHTPGPWAWFGNAGSNSIYLATEHHGRRYVMSFKRWGMRGAEPVFQPKEGRGMVPASELVTFEVGDRGITGVNAAKADGSVYRLDIRGIDCADARLIAAAPDLLEALKAILPDCGYRNMSDAELVTEESLGNGMARPILNARAAIAKAEGRQ